jgi:RHS repeat-associated protein
LTYKPAPGRVRVRADDRSGCQRARVHRYYDPQTGQFLTVDPDIEQTDQAYAYGGDNPVSVDDPSGTCPNIGGRLSPSMGGQLVFGADYRPRPSPGTVAGTTLAALLGLNALNPPTKRDNGLFRVTLQVQIGKTVIASDPYVATTPEPVARGVLGLTVLEVVVSNRKDAGKWADPFRRAIRYVNSGPPAGHGPDGLSFQGPDRYHVDVAIYDGQNFIA